MHDNSTGVNAARATNLTPRTVMKHVCVVRDALNLPQPRKLKQPTANNYGKKIEMKEENFLKKGSCLLILPLFGFYHIYTNTNLGLKPSLVN